MWESKGDLCTHTNTPTLVFVCLSRPAVFCAFVKQLRSLGKKKILELKIPTHTHAHTHTHTYTHTHIHIHIHINIHIHTHKQGGLGAIFVGEQYFLFFSSLYHLVERFPLMWASILSVFHCTLMWLLELAGLFIGFHNELLIISGPHQFSLGLVSFPHRLAWWLQRDKT